jgi:hypothetical protein
MCARCSQQRGVGSALLYYCCTRFTTVVLVLLCSPALLLYSRALLLFHRCCSLVSAATHIPSVAVFAQLFSSLFCFVDPPLSSFAASGDGNTWHFSFFFFFPNCSSASCEADETLSGMNVSSCSAFALHARPATRTPMSVLSHACVCVSCVCVCRGCVGVRAHFFFVLRARVVALS